MPTLGLALILCTAILPHIPLAATVTLGLNVTADHQNAPMQTTEDFYVSFALDNAFVRQPGVLPPDATNSTRIDLQNPALRELLSVVRGGLLRVGGTYTDFVQYQVNATDVCPPFVPGSSTPGADCPGNSFPCCLPLSAARWRELLQFGADVGMKIGFNLNLLHGRMDQYTTAFKHRTVPPPNQLAPWDPSAAEELLRWTVANVPRDQWPVALGLGNELAWFISPATWARDVSTLAAMVGRVFPAGTAPQIYAPCNANSDSIKWGGEFLDAVGQHTAGGPAKPDSPLSAFTFHGYQHSGATVDDVMEGLQGAGWDASKVFFEQVAAVHTAHSPPGTALWITETAFSASAPRNSSHGGAASDVPTAGMLRAADLPWFVSALGSAAEAGVDVFCKETLAGDWLETIGLWQPGPFAAYTPHPDFWVAGLWSSVMGTRVLGANSTSSPPQTPPTEWLVDTDVSNAYQACPINGSTTVPFLGTVSTAADCQARCQAVGGCTSWAWDGNGGSPWTHRCYGRLDHVWSPVPVRGVISGCDTAKLTQCHAAVPARVFAHCSKRRPTSAVAFAFATIGPVSPLTSEPHTNVELRFPGATNLTLFSLTAVNPDADWVMLNGRNITTPAELLMGQSIANDVVVVPLGAVGFVEAEFGPAALPPACRPHHA